ncbi:hypothetical protein [Rhizobium sp. FKL33]|uniref:hypothetical protein n=1 Tax=Rhizobium sp. FKL33 TaxID=2562307 RepID=UPI0010C1284E|nr:hypothetical protein [Rhizobium sp. FKL33]
MPEAVDSSSRPAPESEQRACAARGLPHDIQTEFENVQQMLAAFNFMNRLVHESSEGVEHDAAGIHLIHKVIIDKLAHISVELDRRFTRAYEQGVVDGRKPEAEQVRKMLRKSLWAVACTICKEHSISLKEIEQDRTARHLVDATINAVEIQTRDKTDPIEAGSFLPWAELQLRKIFADTFSVQTAAVEEAMARLASDDGARRAFQ